MERKLADDRRKESELSDGRRMEAGKNGCRLSGQWADSVGVRLFCERLAQKGGSVAGSKAETSSLILSPADKSGEDDGYKGRARVWVGQSAVCDAA